MTMRERCSGQTLPSLPVILIAIGPSPAMTNKVAATIRLSLNVDGATGGARQPPPTGNTIPQFAPFTPL